MLGRLETTIHNELDRKISGDLASIQIHVGLFMGYLRFRDLTRTIRGQTFFTKAQARMIFQDEEHSRILRWFDQRITDKTQSKPGEQNAQYARWFTAETIKELMSRINPLKPHDIDDFVRLEAAHVFMHGTDYSKRLAGRQYDDNWRRDLFDAILDHRVATSHRDKLYSQIDSFVGKPQYTPI